MDRYLLRSGKKQVRSGVAQADSEATDKMADQIPASPSSAVESVIDALPDSPLHDVSEGARINYKALAIEVARHLAPDIKETLSKTLAASLHQLHETVGQHEVCLVDLRQRCAALEEENSKSNLAIQEIQNHNIILRDRLEDLENRSRRNNLRLLGLPEGVKAQALKEICKLDLPKALGLDGKHKVERAHRIGTLPDQSNSPSRSSNNPTQRPRPVIMRYLDYCDKEAILRAYRARRGPLRIKGQVILLFADYSAQVAKLRREFSGLCSALYRCQIKFQLQYPATLRVAMPDGTSAVFSDPCVAMESLQELLTAEDARDLADRGRGNYKRWERSRSPEERRLPQRDRGRRGGEQPPGRGRILRAS